MSLKDDMFKRLDNFRRFGSTEKLPEGLQGDDKTRAEMARNRAINRRTGALSNTGNAAGRSGADISFATGRPRDPLFYWRQNNLPYDFADPDELRKVRLYSRLLYLTHPMIASCVDIYSKFPLLGMELRCKDDKLTEFYTDLFLDEDGLNYEEFMLDVGREYWTVGEAWPFATFNEKLGIWDSEELLNADDVEVQRSPFMKDPRYFIRLPETIRRVLNERQPAWEYAKLVQSYPELVHYGADDARMPVSNVLLQQLRFKSDTFNARGVTILTRAMRSVIQEEMLNSAVDAIADRLYTPLILARLGASATDLGTEQPWIPNQDQLADFEEALDAALAADFRALVYHFAVQIEPVFGREQMPDLTGDFDRLEDRILQTFGLSKTMLTGADAGETYAADALNRDLIAQLLTTYQKMIIRHYRKRALIVAEAQEHYDYEERNGKRYVITEEILEVDEESGEEYIVEQPKLLIPDMQMRCLALGTKVHTPDGPMATEDLRVGDMVAAWDPDEGMVERPVVMSESNGVKSVYEVSTKLGRSIRATAEHPFLTDRGWVAAQDVKAGDRIRVARGYVPSPSDLLITADEAYFFGVMTGDGGMTGRCARLSGGSAKEMIIGWVEEFANARGCELVGRSEIDYDVVKIDKIKGARNPIMTLLREHGLWGRGAAAKRVPASVWSGGPEIWRAFLSGYLDTDGTVQTGDRPMVSWTSVSKELLGDVQTLLSFLGVRAKLAHRVTTITSGVTHRGTDYDSERWILTVAAKESLEALQEGLELWHHGKRDFMTADLRLKITSSRVDADHDEVVSVVELAPEPTWALTIEGCHTHVTEGLVTHNTMNLRDEEVERQFLESLAESGIPISIKTRLTNIPIDFDEEIERKQDEQVRLAVAEQETRKQQYQALRDNNLPIPQDLRNDFEPRPMQAPLPDSPMLRTPSLGIDPTGVYPNIAPTPEDMAAIPAGQPVPSFPQAQQPGTPVVSMGEQQAIEGGAGDDDKNRPEESDEQRERMPKKSSADPDRPRITQTAALWKRAKRVRDLAVEHGRPVDVEALDATVAEIKAIEDEKLRTTALRELLERADPQGGNFGTPTHIGMRRHVLNTDLPDDMLYEPQD